MEFKEFENFHKSLLNPPKRKWLKKLAIYKKVKLIFFKSILDNFQIIFAFIKSPIQILIHNLIGFYEKHFEFDLTFKMNLNCSSQNSSSEDSFRFLKKKNLKIEKPFIWNWLCVFADRELDFFKYQEKYVKN
jgi:hypothetical protein